MDQSIGKHADLAHLNSPLDTDSAYRLCGARCYAN
jgi:hypothetical protein